jgi:hypothetical protein
MNNISPEDLRIRAKGVASFDKTWYADPKTLEIRRKPLTCWQIIINLFWKNRHKVSDLYWWVSKNWANQQLAVYPIAIEHDNIPAPGFPRKHIMRGGWSIPKKDLKYLYEGPLFDQLGTQILVKHQSRLQVIVAVVKHLQPLSWIIGFLLLCVRYSNEIKSIFKWIDNAL